MKISSVIDIVDGILQNIPSISFIYQIKTNSKKVQEGDLFIAKNQKDIELAIQRGAFAIVYDFDTKVIDNEIAWIKVDSFQDALIKLFRFQLSHEELDAYYCDSITFDLISIYKNNNKRIKLIASNLENSIKIIENIKPDDIIFCKDKALLNKIYPKYKTFNSHMYDIKNLIKHSIFETSFSFEEHFFSKIKISSLYLNQFLDVYNFFEKDIDIQKLKSFEHLQPIFIDRFINVIEFGRSDKFILCQKNLEFVPKEMAYIKSNYKYARTIYLTSRFINDFPEEQFIVSSVKKLKQFLKNKKFNAVYLIGFEKVKVEKFLLSSQEQFTLI